MKQEQTFDFYWLMDNEAKEEVLSDADQYQKLTDWASRARGKNPNVFDAVTDWMCRDSEWTKGKLAENEKIFKQGILQRFQAQNAYIRMCLERIQAKELINPAVYEALDIFDAQLAGRLDDASMQDVVRNVFSDFSLMANPEIRAQIAGNPTGSLGVNTQNVDIFGYVQMLKEGDAALQWTLFMPDLVKRQQNGFHVQSFEYKKMPPLRFIGKEIPAGGMDAQTLQALFAALDEKKAYRSGFDYDLCFRHHYGKGVDVEPCHAFWGRFMQADTPVPEGFLSFDLIPQKDPKTYQAGAPFIAQFAWAKFEGDAKAMHQEEGFDSDAMYDVTRNIILGQNVEIPYPNKYWVAEVYINGYQQSCTDFLFGVLLP